jgi:hypothetical protein
MHNHGVVDNNKPPREGTIFFPEYLQKAGYNTAFVGKWHMGELAPAGRRLDDPQPGFDHWVSFAGQGHYYPIKPNGEQSMLNINGDIVKQKGYITDELTDYAVDWLDSRDSEEPFFMYLSHKAVHANFAPAQRHSQQYADRTIPVPDSQADTPENYEGKPMWVKNQRNSWHGVDFPYHSSLDVQAYKMRYHQALSAVDDSLGRLFQWLEDNDHTDDTIMWSKRLSQISILRLPYWILQGLNLPSNLKERVSILWLRVNQIANGAMICSMNTTGNLIILARQRPLHCAQTTINLLLIMAFGIQKSSMICALILKRCTTSFTIQNTWLWSPICAASYLLA